MWHSIPGKVKENLKKGLQGNGVAVIMLAPMALFSDEFLEHAEGKEDRIST